MLENNVRPLAHGEEVPEVVESAKLHLLLRVARLGAHVGQKGCVRKFQESRIDLRLVGVDVEADSTQLRKR